MRRKSTVRVDSQTKSGEDVWYTSVEGRRQTRREFEKALRSGTLIHSAGSPIQRTNPDLLMALLEQAKTRATRPVSLRLPVSDIERAKDIASRKGTGYQTVLKEAIRRGLKRAG